jgi:hypothetical protein
VIGIRDETQFGPPFCTLDILAADRSAAAATRAEIERLMRVHDVFRGQVLSFTESEHHGNELVSFLPRPRVTARDVVLPEGVLESIEQHIIGVAEWSRDLLSAGQHLKRGLLLHGPPGTGKTHTVRYLTGRLTGSTVILLTGRSIRFIDAAAALARRLQPSMVVLEDVDLVATDRDYTPGERPPVLRDAHFSAVLTEMNGERHALTRSLLGTGPRGAEPAGQEPGVLSPSGRRSRLET